MGKIKEIYEGFKNSIFKKIDIEKLARKRLKHCNTCNFKVGNKCSKYKCETIDNIEVCGCNCYISKKVRSPQSICPKKLWLNEDRTKSNI